MTDFQDIQRLIRLKRFETPGEDFVEDFVSQFRERQRSELLRQSARGLLWERMNTYFEHLMAPKWATAGATAAMCFLGTWAVLSFMNAGPGPDASLAALTPQAEAVAPSVQPSLDVDSPLMAEAEGESIGIEAVLISSQMEFGDSQLIGSADHSQNLPPANLLPVLDLR